MAEERLTSGDYVRVANALKAASKDFENVLNTPLRILTKPVNSYIKFNTLRGDVVNLVIMNEKLHIMPGDTPNVTTIIYNLNGIISGQDKSNFVQQMVNVMNCIGIVNIERDYLFKHSYKNMKEFKKDIKRADRQTELHYDDDDDDDDDDYCEPNDSYIIRLFLGLDNET